MSTVKVSTIHVGDRVRKDLGDLTALATSIHELGLLQPILVRAWKPNRPQLVAGERRLEAVKLLGWDFIPAHEVRKVSDTLTALRAEREENTERKEFTPSEAVAIAEQIHDMLAAEAKERQGTRTDLEPSANLAGSSDTREAEAEAVGMKRTTLAKAKKVEQAKADPNPLVAAVAQEASAEMDETGKVDPAYQKVEQAKKLQADIDADEAVIQAKKLSDLAKILKRLASVATDLAYVEPWCWTASDIHDAEAALTSISMRITDLVTEGTERTLRSVK